MACAGMMLGMPLAQAQKKTLGQDAFHGWRQVAAPQISDNGRWVVYGLNPARGDGQSVVYDAETRRSDTLHRASGARLFGPAATPWVAAKVIPTYAQQRQEKIKKTKADKKRPDTLLVVSLAGDGRLAVPRLKSFQTADREGSGMIAYLYEVLPAKAARDTADSVKKATKTPKFNRLVLRDAVSGGDSIVMDSVESYALSRNGRMLLYSIKGDSLRSVWACVDGRQTELYRAKIGKTGSLAVDEQGTQGAYLVTPDTTETGAQYQLYHFTAADLQPQRIAGHGAPNGFTVSEYGSLKFSREGGRLFFGMNRPPRVVPKDTLPDDEKSTYDLWSYTDTLLMTQQLAMAKQIRQQSFRAVYDTRSGEWVLLGDKYLARVVMPEDDEAQYALGIDEQPYEWASTWESPGTKDLYAVDLTTGTRRKVAVAAKAEAAISPDGKYIVWYDAPRAEWKAVATAVGKRGDTTAAVSLTAEIPYRMDVQNFDMPDYPSAEGMAGWTTDGRVVIYDNFDLWLTDPSGRRAPECLTRGIGRRDSIAFRYVQLDPEERAIDLSQPMLLSAFDRGTKAAGYYRMPAEGGEPERLIAGDYKYTFVAKAREADELLWQRENFREYRDLWRSDCSFADARQVSDANPQAAQYRWGTVQRVAWEDMNGRPTEGLLYLPEDYDSTRRYPVIVYFYETHTDDIHKHLHPQPSWSIVVPVVCTSQDYVVFMPDIHYRIGYPGQSCYDAVVSGAKMLIDRGIADPRRIGLQGQSWGGYQIAYLVTRTDMFRCASPGAPVSNMTSATGGIRWGSGLPRMFQYEHGQSRIGGSLWEKPIEYIENSPLFFANKVHTPMLMRHDDADEAVPWYQGIEYFLALRRHGVPVWMLNYNGQPHNLRRYADRLDWDRRMMQFFDHYLKGAPAPRWMREGIPVTDKGIDPKLDY